MLKLKLQYFGHLMRRTDSLKKALMLGKIEGEGDDRVWDGWMASLTWWTWVWVNSGSWWWTGRSGLPQSQSQTRPSDWTEPTPVFWPGELHALYSRWGCKESDLIQGLALALIWERSQMFSLLAADNKSFLVLLFTSVVSFNSVQFSSVAQSCPTLCDPMNHSTPGLPVHHQLPEFTQTHVHQVRDAIQPSHPLSFPSPPALNPSLHQSLFQWGNSLHEVAKILEFQLQHQSSQWTPGTDLL